MNFLNWDRELLADGALRSMIRFDSPFAIQSEWMPHCLSAFRGIPKVREESFGGLLMDLGPGCYRFDTCVVSHDTLVKRNQTRFLIRQTFFFWTIPPNNPPRCILKRCLRKNKKLKSCAQPRWGSAFQPTSPFHKVTGAVWKTQILSN